MVKGRYLKTIFHREDNGYTVALFELEENKNIEETVVVGYMGELDNEKQYELEGQYVEHPKYGIQFKVEGYHAIISMDEEGLIKYFSSSQFNGIGKKYAKILVDTLGVDIISKIKENNAILDTVEKMTSKKKQAIIDGINSEEDEDYIFLSSHHLSMKTVYRLKREYEDQLMSVLLSNPYLPVREIDGIGFATMDKFALSIGIDENDFNRLVAKSESILMEQCMRNGDSYLPINEYIAYLNAEGINDTDEIIEDLLGNRRIAIENDNVYHISQYDAERYIAGYLAAFPMQDIKKVNDETVAEHLTIVEEELAIKYEDKQLEAVQQYFKNDVMILTGGPGTGKTTIVRGMIELTKRLYPQYVVNLVAPTGRAAKRLGELTNCDAKTIHSLLLWDKETGKFSRNEESPINVDILIIDEFSMVDQYLFYNLLKACTYLKKLVIIGDVDQLPSVAMGAVLRDLIDCGKFLTIRLDKIYRQKEGSDIIALANEIKNDNCHDIPVNNDVRFFECSRENIADITLHCVELALNKFDSLDEGLLNVQVLAPKHKGLNGINNMNVNLQKRFNPPSEDKKEISFGYKTFREHDKVIQLKNQPDDDVYNGDIGIIIEIISPEEDYNHQPRVIVDFDGRIVEYTYDTLMNITHAYCISVHKAQGSEYPIVILPLDNEYSIMLQKRLIYTAVSRAYRYLIMIGQKSAFYKGISTKDYNTRKTTLKERIEKLDVFEG